MQNYVNSKFQLVENMTPQEHFVYYADDDVIAREIATRSIVPEKIPVSLKRPKSGRVYFDGDEMVFELKESFNIAQSDTTLKGPHNLINTMAAVTSVYLAGVGVNDIRKALKTFVNAPHRLESVGVINGVEFINDSKATNVDSVVYALGSYDGPLIWIAGGIDKGNDYNLIMEDVRKKVRALICLGKDNEKLKKAFGGVVPVIKETQSVEDLVKIALDLAERGDVVLLSPACASFDLFRNYEDRGNQFRNAVKQMMT
jgi:UDP-N-acetylmuramoylalanine--D-glutamate ligase